LDAWFRVGIHSLLLKCNTDNIGSNILKYADFINAYVNSAGKKSIDKQSRCCCATARVVLRIRISKYGWWFRDVFGDDGREGEGKRI